MLEDDENKDVSISILGRQESLRPIQQERKLWKSCCLTLDRGFTVYVTQYIAGILILVFCAIMLYLADFECNKSASYLSIISFILGQYLGKIKT
jgi:ABC-type nickel/cobalt efflux system permease component RcnA